MRLEHLLSGEGARLFPAVLPPEQGKGSNERQVRYPVLLVLLALFIIYGDKEAGLVPSYLDSPIAQLVRAPH